MCNILYLNIFYIFGKQQLSVILGIFSTALCGESAVIIAPFYPLATILDHVVAHLF